MRYLVFILIFVILLAPSAVSREDYVAPTTIGIIGAMDIEIQLYLEELDGYETIDIGGLKFHEGVLNGQPVVIVKSGVGKIDAACAATLLIHEFKVNAVIFSGVAGGVDPNLLVGDIVIADKLLQHDWGIHSPDGFQWWENEFHPHEMLSEIALQSAKNTEFPVEMFEGVEFQPNIVMGTIVTGDQFIQSDEYVEMLYDKFDAACTEMEGASVAAICEKFHVPYVVIRCLSDRADDIADVDFDVFAPYAARACSLIVLQILKDTSLLQETILSKSYFRSPKPLIMDC